MIKILRQKCQCIIKIEYSDNYSKTSGSLRQYCKDIQNIEAVNNNGKSVEFNEGNATDSFDFMAKITGQPGANGRKNVEIMVPLTYLRNIWKTLGMPLINCKINLILTCSAYCVIVSTNNANQGATFATTETKLYILVMTLSI